MFLRYAREVDGREVELEAYRSYVADCVKALAGAKERYWDIVHPAPDFDVDEVIEKVIESSGLEVLE